MANCYLVYCADTMEGILIDPGAQGKAIGEESRKRGVDVKHIVNTHGHHDHIGGNYDAAAETGAGILIHREDASLLTDAGKNLSSFLGEKSRSPEAAGLLEEGDVIKFGNESLEVIHSPGHTRGGIALYSADGAVCFTGDSVFQGSIGRTDFPGGDYDTLISSIKEKIMTLPDETVLYPGHGYETTVREEKRSNPFLR